MQIYVSRLRSRLGHDRILTTPSGYVLPAGPDDVDASQGERLVAEGRRLLDRGRPEEAETPLTQALGLWRGDT